MAKCTNPRIGARLHAYELGLLESDDCDQFEAHLLDCEVCCEELRTNEQTVRLLLDSEQIREAVLRGGECVEQQPNPLRGTERDHSWRLALYALAAVVALLLYPAYLGFRELSGESVESISAFSLVPTRSQSVPILHRSEAASATLMFACRGCTPGGRYRLVISNGDGAVVFKDDAFEGFTEFGTANLLLHLDLLSDGEYRMTISDLGASPPVVQQEYFFRIET